MTSQTSLPAGAAHAFPRDLVGALDAASAARIVAAGGDVAMVIDSGGFIRDLSIASDDLMRDGFADLVDRPWADTVTLESRHKVEELLSEAKAGRPGRWREINHATPRGDNISLRYTAVSAGHDGQVIALGRDHRAVAALQQRLVQAQQTLERDYTRLRDAESRYRLLFQMASEAVMVVDAGAKRIVEANPAAERLVGGADGGLVGRPFARVFEPESRDAAAALLTVVQSAAHANAQPARLEANGRAFAVAASVFRLDRTTYFLVRLTPQERDEQIAAPPIDTHMLATIARLPDAFVITDERLQILGGNAAFLDLTQLGSEEQARGRTMDEFLGRVGVDRNILLANLREHGVVRNFATVARNLIGETIDVEVSAAYVRDADNPCFGFAIRTVARRMPDSVGSSPALPHSVEQLSQLVGRVKLKDLVRETTDMVERLCIEAALDLTGNNRASAAEILGLSRQSLYSKLHRYNLASPGDDEA